MRSSPTTSARLGALRRIFGRRAVRWAVLGIGAVLGAGYGWALYLTYQPAYTAIPASLYDTRSPAQLGYFLGLREHLASKHPEMRLGASPAGGASRVVVPPTPLALQTAARTWVDSVNQYSPQSVLWHRADPLGNLHVMFGAWFLELEPDQMVRALDSWGMAWRMYMRDSFGTWDTRGGFAPGIVVIDTLGLAAENRNGTIRVIRRPQY